MKTDISFAKFADNRETLELSDIRTGLLVAMLSIGTLVGALIAGPVANNRRIGRKYSICLWCVVFCLGNILQIAAQYPVWYVMMIGRIISGLAIGGLSVMVPAYQGESAPTHLRGAIVCCCEFLSFRSCHSRRHLNLEIGRADGLQKINCSSQSASS
jgi:MFS transporter, SP family, sugar:H+ symporter